MSIRFAGSRCVDERRRRRLAQEAEPESTPERRPAPRARSAHRDGVESEAPAHTSAVGSLVRPQLWANLILACVGLSVSVGSVWLGFHVDSTRPTLAASLGLESGLLGRALVAFHFLVAAQLAYVILWYRTRSRKDFRGQFKLWRWVGPAWLLLAVASAIDGRTLIQELLLTQISVRFWHAETLCWMAPAAILVLTTTRFLLYDLREDRWGTTFVLLSAFCAALAALTVLAGPLMAIDRTTVLIVEQTSVCVWSLAALLSMLFHARYVIHVTNEAPRLGQPGRIMAMVRHLMPRMPRRRPRPDVSGNDEDTAKEAAADEAGKGRTESAEEKSKKKSEDRPVAVSARPEKRRRRTDPKNKARPEPKVPDTVAPKSEQDPGSKMSERSPPSAPDPDTGAPGRGADNADQESFQGMSKKERRRLRKQHRQQQQSQRMQL